jgi:hypothetical protein
VLDLSLFVVLRDIEEAVAMFVVLCDKEEAVALFVVLCDKEEAVAMFTPFPILGCHVACGHGRDLHIHST